MPGFNIINLIFPKLKKIQNIDFRAAGMLMITGFIVAIFWSFNGTLVYDDIGFVWSFPGIVDRIGWLHSLVTIFALDFPTEYRTYGLSRVIQFLIWSLGGSSAFAYSTIISSLHAATVLTLYALLVSLRFKRIDALTLGLIWLISPFIGTSCFHHFSYLILPVSIGIIGAYFLFNTTGYKKKMVAILLGFSLALTGELHLMAISVALVLMAVATGNRLNVRLSLLVIFTMLLTLAAHYLVWSKFIADKSGQHRFSLNIIHDMDYWIYRIYVAARGIGWSIEEQLSELAGQDYSFLIWTTLLSSSVIFIVLRWVVGKDDLLQVEPPRRSALTLASVLFIFSSLYLFTFVVVVVLTDTVPSTMPRRYGYIPLTFLLAVLVLTISESFPQQRQNKLIIISIFLGVIATLFFRYQIYILPATNKVDNNLSKLIFNELRKDPTKGVLLFNSSQNIFSPIVMDDATFGPTKRRVISAEVSQSKYGTYLPTYLNLKLVGSPFTCYLRGVSLGGNILPECSPRFENPGVIHASDAIIVANLGFEENDPLGKQVRVFKSFADFEPFFFSKQIIRGVDWLGVSDDVLAVDLGAVEVHANVDGIYPDKKFTDPVNYKFKSWLINYGLISGVDGKYTHSSVAINSDYYRSNRYGNFEYGFKFSESDVVVDLDFWELWGRKPGDRLFEIQVSWNDGAWVSLGDVDVALINGDKPFSIRLSHQNTNSFKFRLSAAVGTKDVPFIQGVRISRMARHSIE